MGNQKREYYERKQLQAERNALAALPRVNWLSVFWNCLTHKK